MDSEGLPYHLIGSRLGPGPCRPEADTKSTCPRGGLFWDDAFRKLQHGHVLEDIVLQDLVAGLGKGRNEWEIRSKWTKSEGLEQQDGRENGDCGTDDLKLG